MADPDDAVLKSAMDKAVEEMQPRDPPSPPRTNLRPIDRPEIRPGGSLQEQLTVYENVKRQLGERIRREMIRLEQEYRQRRQAAVADHEIRIHETVVRMEAARDLELTELAKEYHAKIRDVEGLSKRMGGE